MDVSPDHSGPGRPSELLGLVIRSPGNPPALWVLRTGREGGRGRKGEAHGRGPLRPEDQEMCHGHFPHPLGPQEACWALGPGLLSSWAASSCWSPGGIGGREDGGRGGGVDVSGNLGPGD